MAKAKSLDQIEVLMKRLRTRLKRTMTALDKLERQRARLMKPVKPVKLADTTFVAIDTTLPKIVQAPLPVKVSTDNDLDIPEFLRRGQAAQKAVDDQIAKQIIAEQSDLKKRKALGRIATMKAKKAGDTKRMPLTGKAALAAIRASK